MSSPRYNVKCKTFSDTSAGCNWLFFLFIQYVIFILVFFSIRVIRVLILTPNSDNNYSNKNKFKLFQDMLSSNEQIPCVRPELDTQKELLCKFHRGDGGQRDLCGDSRDSVELSRWNSYQVKAWVPMVTTCLTWILMNHILQT